MGAEYSPTKIDRQGPKSKSVIGKGDETILPKFDGLGLKSNLLNRTHYTHHVSKTDGIDREKNIATYGQFGHGRNHTHSIVF